MDVDKVIKAPVVKGQEYGAVRVTLNGEDVIRVPLVAMENVEEGGILKQIWHTIMLFFMSLIS
jgi:D-alanyl-D-alanine carboxypeptidase (penicillin-binding protein 5/6)